ncbi:MAG: type II secretion system F family protein [Planctomycetota bacterium]|jgi:type IV pilus assembly protein PilC
MIFGSRVPQKTLANLCRSLATLLESGVMIRRALGVVGKKAIHPATRRVLLDVQDDIDSGSDIESALRLHGNFFPALFLDMVGMAEQSGALPEVLRHLADHYENAIRMQKEFIQSIAWPAFQYVAANLVIAILILVLGMIAGTGPSSELSFLVFGLQGPSGAITWLTFSLGIAGLLVGAWKMSGRVLEFRQIIDPGLMLIPVLGRCMRCFALARFSWSYFLTQQTGMPVVQSLKASLKATSNGAFIGATDDICLRVLEGDTLTESLAASQLFPEDYIEMVSVAEQSGTVPEALYRLSPQFEEDARRAMKSLTSAAGVVLWLTVAIFIIIFIFRFAMWYVGMLEGALEGTM